MLELQTVLEVKRALEQWTGAPPERQRLTFDGMLLKTHRTLVSYHIPTGSFLYLHISKPYALRPNE